MILDFTSADFRFPSFQSRNHPEWDEGRLSATGTARINPTLRAGTVSGHLDIEVCDDTLSLDP